MESLSFGRYNVRVFERKGVGGKIGLIIMALEITGTKDPNLQCQIISFAGITKNLSITTSTTVLL